MATINSYISDIQEYFNNGQKSDDFVLSNRLIYKELKAIRSKLLKEKIDKQNSKNISDSNYSNLYCIEIIQTKMKIQIVFNCCLQDKQLNN